MIHIVCVLNTGNCTLLPLMLVLAKVCGFSLSYCSGKGIEIDPKIIITVNRWLRPLYPLDIINFMGLVGYYKRSIEWFSSSTSPMTTLTQKEG